MEHAPPEFKYYPTAHINGTFSKRRIVKRSLVSVTDAKQYIFVTVCAVQSNGEGHPCDFAGDVWLHGINNESHSLIESNCVSA